MKNKLEEPPKTYTAKDIDNARKEGYELAEQLYSKQALMIELNKLKEEIKRLNDKTL